MAVVNFRKNLPSAVKLQKEGFFCCNPPLLMIIILDNTAPFWLYDHTAQLNCDKKCFPLPDGVFIKVPASWFTMIEAPMAWLIDGNL
jgi:hypothetical protein